MLPPCHAKPQCIQTMDAVPARCVLPPSKPMDSLSVFPARSAGMEIRCFLQRIPDAAVGKRIRGVS